MGAGEMKLVKWTRELVRGHAQCGKGLGLQTLSLAAVIGCDAENNWCDLSSYPIVNQEGLNHNRVHGWWVLTKATRF